MKFSAHTTKLAIAASFGSLTYGFTSGLGGSIPGLPSFIEYFGYLDNPGIADAFNGLYAGGGIIGCILGGIVSGKCGRKKAIFLGGLLGIIGGALMTGAVNLVMLYISRFIAGISIGMCVMLTPIWQTEIAPAQGRGFLVGLHGVMILTGYSLSMWSVYGFYWLEKGYNWRIPLSFQIIWPLCLSIIIWKLPESPRWLLENNKLAETRKVLEIIDPNTTDESFQIILDQFAKESQLSTWKSLITHKPNRKRLIVGFLIMFSAQSTGDLTVTNYGPTLYRNLGFSPSKQIMLSACYISTAVLYNFIASLIMDKLGRKKMMFIGLTGCCVCLIGLAIVLALFSESKNMAGNRSAVFLLYFRLTFYGTFLDATTYVYATEIWPTHLRGIGSSLSFLGMFISMLAYITPVTTALENIKWKFYVIFICLTAVNSVIVFWYFPETKNLTLEEIGALFGDYDEDSVIGDDKDIEGIELNDSSDSQHDVKQIHESILDKKIGDV
ncbi:Hexose transporter 2 [Wickerhamomyces ciferrii]|uniref:Hexose transporter 2 n=1 Tax=Wickerhamomyces ciferrii (strain ATCC 14091 / BCRC 22168 / CBS 111 / JCM 3599 / NBRC 0793 / NRRL Y-1031 F-60-10) TaxID=1206466 RepID=K0KQV6_WICCF|nr:Hexose transporter 2 [Wickerhamomyces ciferrii]CCH43704.1 Hexose transporter 2 [Wickerhamomyces ciferrii]